MGKFNSDGHGIYHCRQESLRRNGVALIVNKRDQNAVLGCNLKYNRMISVHFQSKPFNVTVIQVYAPATDAEEAEVDQFHEDLLELIPKKKKKKSFSSQEATWLSTEALQIAEERREVKGKGNDKDILSRMQRIAHEIRRP